MSLKLNGAQNGSIQLDVPAAIGSDLNVTLPATAGEIVVANASGDVDLGGLTVSGSAADDSVNVDSSGRLLVGTSTARSNLSRQGTTGITPFAQIESATNTYNNGLSIINNSTSGFGAILNLATSYSTNLGSNVIGGSGNQAGTLNFLSNDGTNFIDSAQIAAFIDGTPGTNDMPGRLVFSTTANGASSPTERVRIAQNGQTEYRNCPFVGPITDNATLLGGSGFRWSQVWAANGTIQTSDQRAKTEITDAALGSDFIKSLRPVSYKWLEGGKRDTGERDEDNNYIYESVLGKRTHWGFVAQEVKQAVDAVGVDFGGWVLTDKDDPDSQQALRYDQFIAPLTKALQEALEKIETLEAKVAALEANP